MLQNLIDASARFAREDARDESLLAQGMRSSSKTHLWDHYSMIGTFATSDATTTSNQQASLPRVFLEFEGPLNATPRRARCPHHPWHHNVESNPLGKIKVGMVNAARCI
jgi:hypothetical protein